MSHALIIPGRPTPKKNNLQLGIAFGTGKRTVRQNDRYQAWERAALIHLHNQWRRTPTLTTPHRITVNFYEHPAQRFDLAGVFQAVCDVLEKARVIDNDRLLRQSGPMAIYRDATQPRVELLLEEIDLPPTPRPSAPRRRSTTQPTRSTNGKP